MNPTQSKIMRKTRSALNTSALLLGLSVSLYVYYVFTVEIYKGEGVRDKNKFLILF